MNGWTPIAELHTHTLYGCAPTPLASYLKALGVLRLLATPANSTSGKAADASARGWWAGERYNLRTRFDRDALLNFLLEDYAPSPIIAPWNGGSGFYPGDNTDGFEPLASAQVASRFRGISSAIALAAKEIARRGLKQRPDGADKVAFVSSLRARLPEAALEWLDAALALSGTDLAYPQLLGTGGNDGRLDFTNNFMRRLVSSARPNGLFDAADGTPGPNAKPLLASALFAVTVFELSSAAIGQFSPGAAGGPNATAGYEGDASINPWDFVLMLEGAALFGGVATRRNQGAKQADASFPFTVRATGSGWGGIDVADENDARAEFWAPLWSRPAAMTEIAALLSEGRAVLNGRTVRDGLDFARSASSLGVSRGIGGFERYGFVMRAGKAYLAIPIGRHLVSSKVSRGASLISDLDAGGWLARVRRLARGKSTPARARLLVHRFEDALFDLTRAGHENDGAQQMLLALGDFVSWLTTSREGRETAIALPPRLSRKWVYEANDGTPEFRIAAALASLGWHESEQRDRTDEEEAERESVEIATEEVTEPPENGFAPKNGESRIGKRKGAPPMAAHFAPVSEPTVVRMFRHWAEGDTPTVVWGAGNLVHNMIAVLERRLIEQAARGLHDKPLAGASPARLADIATFLDPPSFSDKRCGALLAGLVWAEPARLGRNEGPEPVPFAYAALKPLFSPDDDLRSSHSSDPDAGQYLPASGTLPIPPGLVARLRRGGRDAIDRAVREALGRARASGIGSPFASERSLPAAGRFGAGIEADRLAAALMIPISNEALQRLMERAYPEDRRKEETDDAA